LVDLVPAAGTAVLLTDLTGAVVTGLPVTVLTGAGVGDALADTPVLLVNVPVATAGLAGVVVAPLLGAATDLPAEVPDCAALPVLGVVLEVLVVASGVGLAVEAGAFVAVAWALLAAVAGVGLATEDLLPAGVGVGDGDAIFAGGFCPVELELLAPEFCAVATAVAMAVASTRI
jgi:hypothetical protein